MLSILIVDDEVITRKGLKAHIDWDKLQIGEIYDAGNAADALEVVASKKPDLILSDVSMPGMNGIEMCRKIREIHKECQIVFLSGYSDKEYLKGAIQLEAVSYVEKPIDIDEVEEALAQAVEKQKNRRRRKEQLNQLVTENRSLTERSLIEKISLPHVKKETLIDDFKKLKLDWEQKKEFQVLLFKISAKEEHHVNEAIQKIYEIFKGISFVSCRKEVNNLVCIAAFEMGSKQRDTFLSKLKEQNPTDYYCSVGQCVHSLEKVYESYQAAVINMQQIFFWDRAWFGFAEDFREKKLEFDESIFEEFSQAVKQYKEKNAKTAVESLHQFMQCQYGVMVSSIKGIYFRFIEALFQKAEFSVGNEKKMDAEIVGLIWEKFNNLNCLESCQHYLEEETEEYFKNVEELAENNKTMIRAISYIQSNYGNPKLCLEGIAEHVYLSPNYFSRLFKIKMGKTLGQYITDTRVSHAKKLLGDRTLKLYDVAVMCGYEDANYFTKIFKKSEGMTPSEYREKYKV